MISTDTRPQTSLGSAWLFINRIAGGCDKSHQHAQLRALLEKLGIEMRELNSPQQLSAQWHDDSITRPDFIISVGGDGTAAMIAGLTAGQVPIAIYPAGTENVLAKYLQIPTDFDAFAAMLTQRQVRHFDAGKCGERTFMLMLSAGFEAEVVHQVHAQRDGHLSKFNYVLPTFGLMRSYAYPKIELDIELEDGTRTQTIGYWVFVFNFPRYALGLELTPNARPDDGLLDVCVLTQKGFWATNTYICSLLSGNLSTRSDTTYYRARSLKIHCDEGALPLQTDGDPAGFTDVTVSVQPGYLPLIVPATKKPG
ncbi:diacylglycerol/lipid kinase family protein [Bremerella cremea]|uniref:diacylglycerol/lipid kinase family protein n=1 Tax=Bremerella cremea TaxID=1031537 RepID=UPI001313DA54|nr:diacylglycerol kinase family protein [Bremerella cremea]